MKRESARMLYVQQGKTQAEIAELLGVAERTVHTWCAKGEWKTARNEFVSRPAQIEENLIARIATLSDRLVDPKETEHAKVTNEIAQLNKTLTNIRRDGNYPIPVYIRVLDEFNTHLRSYHPELITSVAPAMAQFIQNEVSKREK